MMLIIFITLQLLPASRSIAVADAFQIAKPGCPDECGGIKIPYPFGIGDNCFYNETGYGLFYRIKCNAMTPIYGDNITVLNITLHDHTFRIDALVAYQCYKNNQTAGRYWPFLSMVAFTVSSTKNKFVAIGCDTKATVRGKRFDDTYFTGCTTYCTSMNNIENGTCSGVGCCETPIPDGVTGVNSSVWSYNNHSYAPFNPCSAAFVVENGAFTFSVTNLTAQESVFRDLSLPIMFDWSIINASCNSDSKLCGSNTRCVDKDTQGYRCFCWEGYEGNAYLPQGCQDIDECKSQQNQCKKPANCVNTIGNHYCKCPKGFSGNGTKESPCNPNSINTQRWNNLPTGVKVIIGVGIGLIILLVGGFLLHLHHGKKKLWELRESFFRKNGGLILTQKLHGHEISVQKFKIFTTEELEKATDKYSETSIIGKGGFGMVYKGTLTNGQVVAIKRSLKVDPSQVEQFINEVLVLSEINNRNVVKLLGCCLETDVPLLVYEFINNGTLYEHLHDDKKASLLSWDIRLSIAEAVASVLSYLHTTIAIPIIHRDMKSMNILLDENYMAKVSDFGASKLVPADQDQIATVVLGTRGYLDPEYMQTGELTEKSDVYSFGVVLVELLTRKKAVSNNRSEHERDLAMLFLCKMKEGRLFDILDEKIVQDENLQQVEEVADLAKGCLQLKGEERPTMKEVAMELEAVRKTGMHPWSDDKAVPEEYEFLLTKTHQENQGCSSSTNMDDSQGRSMLLSLGNGR